MCVQKNKEATAAVSIQATNIQETHEEQNLTEPMPQQTEQHRINSEGQQSTWARVKEVFNLLRNKNVAPGSPEQPQVVFNNTDKEWVVKLKKKQIAQTHNKVADAASYDMVEQMRDYSVMKQNARNLAISRGMLFPPGSAPRNVMNAYLKGYHINRNGEPATEEDNRIYNENMEMIEDFRSNDSLRRWKHLDRITDEIMNAKITPAMLSIEYLETHAAELSDLSKRMAAYEDLKKDRTNMVYFQTIIDPMKADLLEEKTKVLSKSFSALLNSRADQKGINIDDGSYRDAETADTMKKISKKNDKSLNETFMNDLKNYTQLEDRIQKASSRLNELFENSRAEVLQESRGMQAEIAADNKSYSDLTFEGYAAYYAYEQLDDVRQKIRSNPQNYEKYHDLLDALYKEIEEGLKTVMERELKEQAYQGVKDELNEKKQISPLSAEEDYIRLKAGEYAVKYEQETRNISLWEYLKNCSNTASNLARNKSLKPEQIKLIRDLGYGDVL